MTFTFVGRFVFADDSQQKLMRVLAIDPSIIGAEAHPTLLTVRTDSITDSTPCATDSKIYVGGKEYSVWSLQGVSIDLTGDGTPFRWKNPSATHMSFSMLTGQPAINPQAARKVGGPTAALLSLPSGEGAWTRLKDETFGFAKLKEANAPGSVVKKDRYTDSVKVTFPSPQGVTLRFTGGRCQAISLIAKADVSVTNVCNTVSTATFDGEFAAMYEVLATKPPLDERLVPALKTLIKNGRIDCHSAVEGSL
jgi:hypothetical protein